MLGKGFTRLNLVSTAVGLGGGCAHGRGLCLLKNRMQLVRVLGMGREVPPETRPVVSGSGRDWLVS